MEVVQRIGYDAKKCTILQKLIVVRKVILAPDVYKNGVGKFNYDAVDIVLAKC